MKKRVINLAVDLIGLDEKPIGNAGQHLAKVLVADSKGDALKYYDWAVALYASKPIELDDSDFKKLEAFVKDNDHLTILAKAQILRLLESSKTA